MMGRNRNAGKPGAKNPGKTFKRIMAEIMGRYKPHCVAVALCLIVSAVANVYGTMFMQRLIDDYITPMIGRPDPDFGPMGRAVLGTGNKSENAVGYCTLYGDTVGALEPIGDIYKTDVYKVARFYNDMRGTEIIPENVFTKAPSAELHADQVDEDNLPPYEVLDAVLRELLENAGNPETLVVPGVSDDVVRSVVHKVAMAEFKRHQSAPTLKLSSCTLGVDWHMPATARGLNA